MNFASSLVALTALLKYLVLIARKDKNPGVQNMVVVGHFEG